MIYLMRHGADPVDRYGGWSEYGLTEVGRSQVNSAKHKLLGKGITGIYSSDLNRAKETAEIKGCRNRTNRYYLNCRNNLGCSRNCCNCCRYWGNRS